MSEGKLEYLEKERVIAFERIKNIEEELLPDVRKIAEKALEIAESKITTNEKLAQDSAINAGSAAKTAAEKLEEIKENLAQIKDIISEYKENSQTLSQSIICAKEIDEKYDQLIKAEEGIEKSQTALKGLQAQISSALENALQSDQKIKELENTFTSSSTKISDLLFKSTELKNSIVNLYQKIFGYDTKDENTGEINHEDGLSDELERSYEELRDKQNKLEKYISDFQNKKEEEVKRQIELGNKKFSKLEKKIKSLLPGAMTAGLSFAYKEKRENEEVQKIISTIVFILSVIALVFISMIPVCVDYQLYIEEGKKMGKIIENTHNLFLLIFPLYFPVLWLAWLSNKSINLSKRLIEEYTYKEVLSKTYEGLSDKIQGIDDSKASTELKTKLLFNIVAMSSENPGKLITDYNKTDNPLMEILDKSSSLANAFDKFANIPGLNKIVKVLNVKQQLAEDNFLKKANEGMDLQNKLDREDSDD